MNQHLCRLALSGLALTLLGPGVASAQSGSRLSAADRSFMQENAQGSVHDLSLAQLGMQRATTPALYRYARRVVQDHNRLNLEALDLGRALRVDLPMTLRGKAFDRAFLQEEVRINSEDVAKSQQTRRTTRNGSVYRFATDFHSTESQHLSAARAFRGSSR